MAASRAAGTESEIEEVVAAAITATEAGGGANTESETAATEAGSTAAGKSPQESFLQIGGCLSGSFETVTCRRTMAATGKEVSSMCAINSESVS